MLQTTSNVYNSLTIISRKTEYIKRQVTTLGAMEVPLKLPHIKNLLH